VGGKTAQSTQQVQIPPQVLAQYAAVNSAATQTAQTPFQTYGGSGTSVAPDYSTGNTGSFVAPINNQQQTGITATNTAANEAQPYYGAATSTLGDAQAGTTATNQAALGLAGASAEQVNADPLTGAQINQYMSPYLQDVVGSESALLNQNNQQQQAGQLGTAIQSGAFGGDRTGLAAANLEQQQNLANANIYSGLLNTGYNNALSTAQQQQGVNLSAQQANRAALGSAGSELASIGSTQYGEGANTASELASLGSGAQTAGLQGANAQLSAGTVEQQTQQAQDTAQYNQFLQQQSYPFQVDQFLANIAEGTGALSGSTTTTTQPGGFFSDKRLKHDIKRIGKLYDGQEIYSYKMHGDPRTHIGLIAQKVEKKHPDAVGLASGYKTVDYGKATDEAANRGKFYAGGLIPFRQAKAGGGPSIVSPGDMQAILEAQSKMYAPESGGAGVYGGAPGAGVYGGAGRVPAANLATPHLVQAEGGVRQPPTGIQNVSNVMGLAGKGNELYREVSKPSARKPGLVPAHDEGTDTNASETLVGPPQAARGGRQGLDTGGSPDDYAALVNAQEGMYANQRKQQQGLNVPNQGGSSQLAVAQGSPTPTSSGSSNLSQTIGLAQKGYNLYKKVNPNQPQAANAANQGVDTNATDTLVGPPQPAGLAGADTSAVDASAPAVESSAADAAAPAATDAATGAAADAAGTAAAGAGADAAAGAAVGAAGTAAAGAGTDAAVTLAAEYALADAAAAAVVAAKRGGKIKGYDTGGTPYSDPNSGAPYSDSGMDIPDTQNTRKLQTAGPLQKIPTGLQDVTAMSNPDSWGSTAASVFSNEAAKRGGLIRAKFADGGSPDDADPDVTPPQSGGLKGWWESNKGYVLPALSGIAAMGTAPTKHLGVALASGLGAAANSYVPTQQGIADTQNTQAETRARQIANTVAAAKAGLQTDAIGMARRSLQQSQQPSEASAPATVAPQDNPDTAALSAQKIDQYFRNKYATQPYVGNEADRIGSLTEADKALGTHYADAAEKERQIRIQKQQFTNQMSAQNEFDDAYSKATDKSLPEQQQTAALIKLNALRQWTGDEYKDGINQRTGKAQIGSPTELLSPQQKSEKYMAALKEANSPMVTGAGLPQATYTQVPDPTTGKPFKSPEAYAAHLTGLPPPDASDTGSQGPPAPQGARLSATTQAPMTTTPTTATAKATSTKLLPGVDLDAIPKLPPLPAATDQSTLAARTDQAQTNVKMTNEALAPLKSQVEQAARNNAIYSQLEKKLTEADPNEFGPRSKAYKALAELRTTVFGTPPDGLVNMEEVNKFLMQLGVGGSKQLLGSDQAVRQQELLMLMEHANPNIDQPLAVAKALVAYGKAGNSYDLQAGNTAIEAIRRGADPSKVPGAIEDQMPRANYIENALGQTLRPPARPGQQSSGVTKVIGGKTYTQRDGKWYAE
jgi:hypothetical protein